MNLSQKDTLKDRLSRANREKKELTEKLSALKRENRLLNSELRKLERILAEIPCPLLLVQHGQIIHASEITWKVLGYTREDLAGSDLGILIHPKSSMLFEDYIKRYASAKPIPARLEIYLRKKNGDPLCCDIHWRKIRYNRRTAFLFSMMELDERIHCEKNLRLSQKTEAFTRMAAGLTHHLDSTLNNRIGPSTGPREDNSAESAKPDKISMETEAWLKKENPILQQMRELSGNTNHPAETVLFDPKKIVQDAVTAVSTEGEKENDASCVFKTYLRHLSPVEGHPSEIRQACIGMISNAMEAMPKGGEIYLTTEENSGFAWIYIQDTGVGIPDEIQDMIFDPFFTTKGQGHAGLGLSLAYAAIKRHGGDIEVMSRQGQGATFIIKLPLSVKEPETAGKRQKNRIKESQILLISHESMVTDLLSQDIATKGGKVSEVHCCVEGVKLLKRKSFDLLLVDMTTPDFHPEDSVSKFKGIKNNLPIVLVSPDNRIKNRRKNQKDWGVELIIQKPLEMTRISQDISNLIESNTISRSEGP